jgi:uncharacterized protein YcfJ
LEVACKWQDGGYYLPLNDICIRYILSRKDRRSIMKTIIMLSAAALLFAATVASAGGQPATMATVTNVREVFRIITIREPVTSREEICEEDRGVGGAIVGGVAGGLIGNQFGRGTGNAAMTALGAVAGAATGQSMARSTKCYPRDRVGYTEREQEVIDGYIVTVESGEEFRTKTRYHVGDRVRIRSTIE